MKCPTCNKWSTVLETRNHSRRRECGNGHRFTTREVVINNARSEAMKARWAQEGPRQELKRDDNGKFIG